VHPAFSVILFTTLSGAGFGLLAWVGACLSLAPAAITARTLLAADLAGMVLAATGLASSLFHLGHPERAWRALGQWRSSWLSREGVVAIASFGPALALAVLLRQGGEEPAMRVIGACLLLLAIGTVYCTARIYSSLRTIAAWHNAYVVPGYLLFAMASGGVWLWTTGALIGDPVPAPVPVLTACATLAAIALKAGYFRYLDGDPMPASLGTATGLGRFGTVQAFEAPHTEHNYLTTEMGFRVARKHARRLRRIAGGCGLAVAILLVLGAVLPDRAPVLALASVLFAQIGLIVERWLFFAEARHVVMTYYGR